MATPTSFLFLAICEEIMGYSSTFAQHFIKRVQSTFNLKPSGGLLTTMENDNIHKHTTSTTHTSRQEKKNSEWT